MKESLFPEWSPPDLVETFIQMKDEIESTWQMYAAMDKDELEESGFEKWKKEAAEKDKLTGHLYRLLTDPNMESVWSTLFSQSPRDSNRLRTEPALSLWHSITRALNDFSVFISFQMTTAQKSKNLKSINS